MKTKLKRNFQHTQFSTDDVDMEENILERNEEPVIEDEENINTTLNPDVMITIFSYLHVFDLINVSKTCKNFLAMVKATFPSKFSMTRMLTPTEEISKEEIDAIFGNFGSMIRKLKLDSYIFSWDYGDIERYTLLKIVKHCNKEIITEISLGGFKGVYDNVEALFDTFKNVTKLQLEHCAFNSDITGILNKLKHLEELVLCTCNRNPKYQTENYFSTIHPNIKKLVIRDSDDLNVFRVLNSIDFIMPNLEILEINCYFNEQLTQEIIEALTRIASLNHLIKLKLNFQNLDPIPLMKRLVESNMKLEKLILINIEITTHLISLVAKMKTLKKIKISEVTNLQANNILHLIHGLPLLGKISIHKTTTIFNQRHVDNLGNYLNTNFTLKFKDTGASFFQQNRIKLMEKLIEKEIKLTLLDLNNAHFSDIMEYDECSGNDYLTVIDNDNLKIQHSCKLYTVSLKSTRYDINK